MMAGYANSSIMVTMDLLCRRLDYMNMHVEEQDNYDLNKIYEILENEILPMYYDDHRYVEADRKKWNA